MKALQGPGSGRPVPQTQPQPSAHLWPALAPLPQGAPPPAPVLPDGAQLCAGHTAHSAPQPGTRAQLFSPLARSDTSLH